MKNSHNTHEVCCSVPAVVVGFFAIEVDSTTGVLELSPRLLRCAPDSRLPLALRLLLAAAPEGWDSRDPRCCPETDSSDPRCVPGREAEALWVERAEEDCWEPLWGAVRDEEWSGTPSGTPAEPGGDTMSGVVGMGKSEWGWERGVVAEAESSWSASGSTSAIFLGIWGYCLCPGCSMSQGCCSKYINLILDAL